MNKRIITTIKPLSLIKNVKPKKEKNEDGMCKSYDFSKMKLVKRDFSKMKIVSAPQDKIYKDEAKLNKLLKILGHPEAYCTDESSIMDFVTTKKKLDAVSKKLGFPVFASALLIEVIAKM